MKQRYTVKHRVRRLVSSGESGFTLIELMIVVLIMGIMLGTVTIMTYASLRNTDLKSTAEMVKQDLRKTYALANSGEMPTGVSYRYGYKITFNNNDESPKNSYIIYQGVPNASGVYVYDSHPMTPQAANTQGRSGDSIVPSSNGSTQIDYGGNKNIYFVSVGGITVANTNGTTAPGSDMTINIKDAGGATIPITISGYGNISD